MIIAVQPRLLADTLRRVLCQPGVAVDVVIDQDTSGTSSQPESFDLAIIVGDVPEHVHADVILRLPAGATAIAGSLTTPDGAEATAVGDLQRVVDLANRALRGG